jgi:hypothetical protein
MTEPVPQRRRWVFFLALFLILARIFVGVAWLWEQQTRQSENHYYTYEVSLSFNTTIENVTLLLPLPEQNGTPLPVDYLVNRTVYGIPPDWNLSIEHMNGTPMLAIRASRMVAEYHAYPIPIEPGESPLPATLSPGTEYSAERPVLMPVTLAVMVPVPVNYSINTRDPLSSEPVFYPQGTFLAAGRTIPEYQGSLYTHSVPVFIGFTSKYPATLALQVRVQGTNAIWRGGWVSNSYSDTVILEVPNATQGWLEGKGTLLIGEGVYY